jgi:hypothetical protein
MHLPFSWNFNVILKIIWGNKRERSTCRQIGFRPLVPARITRYSQQGRKPCYFFITRALQKKSGLKLKAVQCKHNVSLSCTKLEYPQMCMCSRPWPNFIFPPAYFKYLDVLFVLSSANRDIWFYVSVFWIYEHAAGICEIGIWWP